MTFAKPPDSLMMAERSLLLKFTLSILLGAASLMIGLILPDLWPDAGFVSGLILLGTGPMFAIRLAQFRVTMPSTPSANRSWRWIPWLTSLAGIGIILFAFSSAAGLVP